MGRRTPAPSPAESLLDPALVDRTRAAAERAVGKPVKVGRGKIEIAFADEHELAELAEAFERAAG